MAKERTAFLDKALFSALIYSLLFHLALFASFRIRLNDYQETSPQMLPLNVAIDTDEPKTTISQVENVMLNPNLLFISNLDPEEYKEMNLTRLCSLNYLASVDDDEYYAYASLAKTFSEEDMLRLSSNLSMTPKMYPLQLKLSYHLKNLTLLEDGSNLFKDKGPYESLGRFVLAANHLPIEYIVTINGTSGKIERAQKEHVLLDKRLQAAADRIISDIRFKPFSEKSVHGSITLIFCCTGDEITSLMK